MNLFRLLLALVLLAIPAALHSADAPAAKFRAGAATSNITPDLGVILDGAIMQIGPGKHVHDELHARCLVLADGKPKVALVVVDSCMMPRELIDAAKTKAEAKTGIPAANILVSATHTHTAPTVGGVFKSDFSSAYDL